MNEGLLFANGAVRTKESGLFTGEKLGRLIESDTLRDAVRVLVEGGYGSGSIPDNPEDFEKLLKDEENAVESFVRKSAPAGSGFECFWLERDYHNLKVLMKAECFGAGTEGLTVEGGRESVASLKEKLEAGTGFNEFASAAIAKIRAEKENGKLTPRSVDCLLDKAAYAEIDSLISARGVAEAVRNYFRSGADLTNIASFARTVAIGGGYEFGAAGTVKGRLPSGAVFVVKVGHVHRTADNGILSRQKDGNQNAAHSSGMYQKRGSARRNKEKNEETVCLTTE